MSNNREKKQKKYLQKPIAAFVIIAFTLIITVWLAGFLREEAVTDDFIKETPVQQVVQESIPELIDEEIPKSSAADLSVEVTGNKNDEIEISEPWKHESDNPFPSLLTQLSNTEEPRKRQAIINQFYAWLDSLPRNEAIAILTDFLDSDNDVEIAMPFHVGREGRLNSHPKLRVAAIDWFGQIAPEKAKEYARVIFRKSESADEWALALRNYGRMTEPGSDPYFNEAVHDFTTSKIWHNKPTGGYAEGFDAIVYNRQIDLLPELVSLFQNSKNMRVLSGVVLENFAKQHREASLAFVIENTDIFGEQCSNLRATIVARADPRYESHLGLVEEYLLDQSITKEEKQVFAKLFPFTGGFMAHRLLTNYDALPLNVLAAIDLNALKAIQKWRNHNSFIHLDEILETAETRVSKYLESAYRGGVLKKK